MQKNLIINADDFGLTPSVAEGILKAHQEGIVTSTTVLINSSMIETDILKLKSSPSLDVGLHLNVTWGKPVSSPSRLKTLLGEDGFFIRKPNFDNIDLKEVEMEWKAQIEKAKSLGLKLTHLDTHHHTHAHPAFLDIIAEIAKREKLAVRSQNSWIRNFLRANAIRTPDHFVEDFYGEGKTSQDHLESLLRFIPEGTTEVCCHPGFVDEELKKISSYNAPRARELETLTNPELKGWLSQNEISLSNFASLPIRLDPYDPSCELKS